jgi:hypothetical protein
MRRGIDVIGHLENEDARHATLMRTIDRSRPTRRTLNTRQSGTRPVSPRNCKRSQLDTARHRRGIVWINGESLQTQGDEGVFLRCWLNRRSLFSRELPDHAYSGDGAEDYCTILRSERLSQSSPTLIRPDGGTSSCL